LDSRHPGSRFHGVTSTNVALSLSNWTILVCRRKFPPGTSSTRPASNEFNRWRFYKVPFRALGLVYRAAAKTFLPHRARLAIKPQGFPEEDACRIEHDQGGGPRARPVDDEYFGEAPKYFQPKKTIAARPQHRRLDTAEKISHRGKVRGISRGRAEGSADYGCHIVHVRGMKLSRSLRE